MSFLHRPLVRRQLDLEDEGRALGTSRYAKTELPWQVGTPTEDEKSEMPTGRRLIQAVVGPTAELIHEFMAEVNSGKAGRRHSAADLLLLVDANEAAYLTARVMTNSLVSGATLQNVAINVANALEEHMEFSAFREINKKGYNGYLKEQEKKGYSRQRRAAVKKMFDKEGCRIETSLTTKVAAGTKLVELVVEATGLFTIDKKPHKGHFIYVVAPTEALQKWFDEQDARCALLDPVKMPMLIRPKRWRSPTVGGYLTRTPGQKFIKQRNKAYHEEIKGADMDRVYNAVNHIQETPWAINTEVLAFMEALWKGGGDRAGLPRYEPEVVPERPAEAYENEEVRKDWKRQAAEVYEANNRLRGAHITMHQRLWIARKFAAEPRMFFPHELDFRGRVYPSVSGGPTPQGDDIGKSLIRFADGKPLGKDGVRWLMIHIANLWGVDKVSFEERVAWVWANSDAILASARDPFDNRFWEKADSPFCALAAAFEWAGYIREGDSFVSHIPVALDGSCSGLQHFSAMLRDPIGGTAVNLTPSEKPQDVYRAVGDKAQEMANASEAEYRRRWPSLAGKTTKIDGEEVSLDEFRHLWSDLLISRSIAKRPTMTYCYSATRFGMQKMILNTLRELDKERAKEGLEPYLGDSEDNYGASCWLSFAIWEALGEVVVAAATAMQWLRDAAKVAAKDGLPVWWTTPMGLPVLQEYRDMLGQRVKVHWAGQEVKMMLTVEGTEIAPKRQENGIAPNFVHSLDASHLMAVAERAKERGINHLAMIHDSFGTHAANAGQLSYILRETFVEQYTPNVLLKFYQELLEQLSPELQAELPVPPGYGSLDLQQVMGSDYIFA